MHCPRLHLLLLLALFCTSSASAATPGGKKIIEYGWDAPTTAYVREHVRDMEKLPFDGVVIKVMSSPAEHGDPLGWQVASGKKFEPPQYEHAIADLRATKFARLTDNFVQVIFAPGIGWFDSDWSSLAHNAACLARVAKLGRCKGIMLDCEDYGSGIWCYDRLKARDKASHSYEDYAKQVRQRGIEFVRALNKEFPDLTLLCLIGPSLNYVNLHPESERYGLMFYFFEGMWEAASPDTLIVDGFEAAYGYRKRGWFDFARNEILTYARMAARDRQAYDKHIRAGIGIWADNNSSNQGWHPEDFSKNYFSPAGFRASLAYGLEASDGYVWVYSERLNWWKHEAPAPYPQALDLAKTGPGAGDEPPELRLKALASKQPGYSDEVTFAEMRKEMTEIYDFPRDGWRFSTDPSNTGEKNGWEKSNFDDSKWRSIGIGKFWEEQGVLENEDYDGYGWYRLGFTAPSLASGKRVFLAVGAADESAWAWVNGKPVGGHDVGGGGWEIPFALDITDALKPAAENSVAVKVLDRMQSGGLWKSIKLMTR